MLFLKIKKKAARFQRGKKKKEALHVNTYKIKTNTNQVLNKKN